MLRVGLTGGLGSGKSTVAAMLRELGAEVTESDSLGRAVMEPGQPVFAEIVRHFGPEVVGADGKLNRARLAELAFRHGRLKELNAIVHPPVIEAQKRWMEEVTARNPKAIAVVESALIFEVVRDAQEEVVHDAQARGETNHPMADWRKRIDCVVVVTAPDEVKVKRYAARVRPEREGREEIEADARNRLKHQVPDAEKASQADYVIDNSGDMAALRERVKALWQLLEAESNKSR
jgi:dephospho-CoA kinase